MGLDNPLEFILHYLLIGGMIGIDYRDMLPMVSANVCVVFTLYRTYGEL